jgi:hypothetical protein
MDPPFGTASHPSIRFFNPKMQLMDQAEKYFAQILSLAS